MGQGQKNDNIPENTPPRMASNERNEPIRTNHPKGTQEAVMGPKLGGKLTQSELARMLGVNSSSISRAKGDPEKLGKLCRKHNVPIHRWDESSGLFFPVEE